MTPTDPRFLDATHEEIVLDYWANAFMDNPELRKEAVTDDYDDLVAQMEAEMAALGSPLDLLAAREAAEAGGQEPSEDAPPTPIPPSEVKAGGVTVTQEVVTLTEDQATDDWEDVVSDRYGATGSLS